MLCFDSNVWSVLQKQYVFLKEQLYKTISLSDSQLFLQSNAGLPENHKEPHDGLYGILHPKQSWTIQDIRGGDVSGQGSSDKSQMVHPKFGNIKCSHRLTWKMSFSPLSKIPCPCSVCSKAGEHTGFTAWSSSWRKGAFFWHKCFDVQFYFCQNSRLRIYTASVPFTVIVLVQT